MFKKREEKKKEKQNRCVNPEGRNIFILCLVAVGFLLLFVGISMASATTVYVATDGSSDYNCDAIDDEVEINAAIDYISSIGGGTVHLKSGTYVVNNAVNVKGAVTLEGDGKYNTVIKLEDHNPITPGHKLVYIDGDTATLQDFAIDGNMANQDWGVNHGADGINSWGDNLEIRRIYMHDTAQDGIVGGGNNWVVRDNYLKDTGHDALRFGYGLQNSIIEYNKVEGYGSHGIRYTHANDNIISHNEIIQPGLMSGDYAIEIVQYGDWADTVGLTLSHNIIRNGNYAGITINSDCANLNRDHVIKNNIFYHCGYKYGRSTIDLREPCQNILIENNVITDSYKDGIETVAGCSDIFVRNNIIVGNGKGRGGYGLNGPGIISNYNDIYDNTLGPYGGGVSDGSGDIHVDPLFANAVEGDRTAVGDYHLKSTAGRWDGSRWVKDSVTSLCIDAGDPSYDYDNEPAPKGGRININAYGGTYEASMSTSGNQPPTAIIESITPDIAEQGKETVSFSGHGTDTDGSVVAYNWRSDVDGMLSTANSFGKPASELSVGAHTIYFKVQDDKGAWSTEVTEELTINQEEQENRPPVADPKGPYTGIKGVPIIFDGSASSDPDGSIDSYEWNFGDGNTATGVAPTHAYAEDGTYTVSLRVTDNDGATDTNTTTATIADTELNADFSATPTNGQKPLTVSFTDNSISYDGIEAWEWDFDNDGETDSTEQNPTHVYTEDGVYTVRLTVTESDGDSDTMTKADYITVRKANEAPYSPDNPSPSDGATEVSIGGALSWTGGDPDDDDTVTYDVYYGTGITPPLVAESQPETTYDPGMRDHSTGYYWQIVAKDNYGASTEGEVWSYTTAASSGSDLVAEWHLDDGSGETAVDSSGNGNDGTLVNNPTWVDGTVGKGLNFDGTDDYIDCGNDMSLNTPNEYTIEMWVYNRAGTKKAPTLLNRAWQSRSNGFFWIYTKGTDNVDIKYQWADGSQYHEVSFNNVLPKDAWTHLAFRFTDSNNELKLYADGSYHSSKTLTDALPVDDGILYLGTYYGKTTSHNFNGIIDEVKIYNRALSAEEIRADYEAGSTNHLPTAYIDSITPDIAEQGKETVSFSGHGADTDGSIVAYNWRSDVDGMLSTASSFGKPASELSVGAHTIYFKVQDDNGAWSAEVTGELTINPWEQENRPPVADPKGPYTGTEGVAIVYDGSGSYDADGSIDSYEWDFGDGNTATGVAPTHTYAEDDTYTVSLIVTDNDGGTDTNTTTATIADTELNADFSASPTNGQEPLTVSFTDNSISYNGIEAWEWDFDNDGTTDSTEQNPTYVYTEEGVYTVSVTVTESDGDSDTMTKADYITVRKANEAPYSPDNPSPSDGATEVSIGGALSWTGGDPDDDDTLTYDVYYGTSITPPLVAESQPETTYDPGMRDHSTGYYWQIVAKDNYGASTEGEVWSYTTAASSGSDLVAEWHLDDGSGQTAVDSSGNGNDGTLVNNPTWVDEKVGKGLNFDGTDDYIDCGDDMSLNTPNEYTIEMWVYNRAGTKRTPTLLNRAWQSRSNGFFWIYTKGADNVDIKYQWADGSQYHEVSFNNVLPKDAWTHLAFRFTDSNNELKLYTDGSYHSSKTLTDALPVDDGILYLGTYYGKTTSHNFNGILDEVTIYNRALSAEEIRADYEAGSTNHLPTAIIEAITPDIAEQGKETVSFSGHGTDTDGTIAAYNWRSSIEGQLSTASSFGKPASELSVGAHTIYFKVQDDNGAWSAEVTGELTINPWEQENSPPVADPKGPYTGTEGVAIVYDGSGSYDADGSIDSYEWDFGDGNTATGVAPTHTYAEDDTYTVSLIVTDNDGGTDTNTTTATIADTELNADFSASPTNGQEPLTVSFTDNSISYNGIEAWEWDFDNDGTTDSTEQNPTYVYTEEGVYTVSVTVTESDGDSDTMTKADYITVRKANEAPYSPDNPSPSDGATEVSIGGALSWTGGDPDDDDTLTYDVYYGTSITPPLVAESQPETTYDPGMRDHSTGYYWQIVAKDNYGASTEGEVWSYTTAASSGSDLVAEWHLDDGSGQTAVDSSGNGNDGTLVNNPTWVDEKVGKGLNFDGTDDYIDCGDDMSLNTPNEYTIEMWVYNRAGTKRTPTLLNRAWQSRSNGFFWIYTKGTDNVNIKYQWTDGSQYHEVSFNNVLPKDAWTHLAFRFTDSNNELKLYTDGSYHSSKTLTDALPVDDGILYLGTYYGRTTSHNFNGILDEVKIYNRALSAEEIRADYEAGSTNHLPTAVIEAITPDIVDTEPTADFSASPTSGRRQLTVEFSDNSVSYDGIEMWEWDFDNDGTTDSTEQNPTYEYTRAGVYTVSLTVYESDGGSDTMTKEDYIEVIGMKMKRNP